MRIEAHLDALAGRVVRETTGEDQPALLRAAKDEKHGDYQVNAAMSLAKKLKKSPRDIARPIAEALAKDEAIASAEVAGPGFVNLRLDTEDGNDVAIWIG